MGRMKEILMEVQEQYGENLEDAPVDFSMNEYLAKRAVEISQERQNNSNEVTK